MAILLELERIETWGFEQRHDCSIRISDCSIRVSWSFTIL